MCCVKQMIQGLRVKAAILQQELSWEMMASRVGWRWAGVIGCQTCLIKLVDRPDLGYGREESKTTRGLPARAPVRLGLPFAGM